uniref:Uncharacterized protein n=1 Tax=Arundo donax TaxID=35708 RepID=A0A0A9AJ74_ARUDO
MQLGSTSVCQFISFQLLGHVPAEKESLPLCKTHDCTWTSWDFCWVKKWTVYHVPTYPIFSIFLFSLL